ncbi:hypothetical protein Emed_004784 [Eimeria media]
MAVAALLKTRVEPFRASTLAAAAEAHQAVGPDTAAEQHQSVLVCCWSSSSSSSSGSSKLSREQSTNDESASPPPAVSAYEASSNDSSSSYNSSSSHSNITDGGSTEISLQRQLTKEQEQQNQQQQHMWCDSGSSSPSSSSSSLSLVSSPQGMLLEDFLATPKGQLLLPSLRPAADAAAGETLAAETPVSMAGDDPDVVCRPLRLCVRRPGLPAAYFSLDSIGQQQHTERQQQQQHQQLQRGAAGIKCDCVSRMQSRACQKAVEETTAAAAAAVAAATKPSRNTAGDGQQVLPLDAALSALVQGRAGPLDRQRQQQQRRLCHAAAPCEGWGVSVCAASCSCCLPASAVGSMGGSQQQSAKRSAVTAARGQKQQQHQRRQEPQEGYLRGCSFFLSVFDGHDSDIAAEFASQALPLLAAKFLPQQIALGEEHRVAAAAAAAFDALDDLFRFVSKPLSFLFQKRCRVIQRVSGAVCTSGCCALSAFVQGSHLFVFNLGDCRCAFLALGDLEELSKRLPAAQQQQQQQQQPHCSGCSTATSPHSCNNSSSRSSGKPSFLSQSGPMRAVCRASPSLRAALKRAGAEEGSVAMSSDDTPASATAAAFTFDQRAFTPLLPSSQAVSPLAVSHEPLMDSAAADMPDAQQQEQQQGKVTAALDASQCGWSSSSSSTNCSTRRASFAAQSSSCYCHPHHVPGCGECSARLLAARPLEGNRSTRKPEKPGITFHWLSRDLRASAPYEMQRLRSLNATVEGGRLGGVLEPSRSVGDFDIKDSQPKGALSSIPETAYLRLTGPGLLLLASDGFWDFVGPEEIIKCLQQIQGVWRPLVKAAKQFLTQQKQRREQATSSASAEKLEVQHSLAASGSSCELEGGSYESDPEREEGPAIHVPTAAALSRLSDRLLRRAKRLGSEDDTTCLVAFIKPIFPF